ncbi:hypothetical protein H0H81_009187 [Sphagnurus paluster]|uniref:Xylanolytic transcriptional activator regulatory domain-containing protein n=1 Tax=Sphagnurus paluster TaxID=117069 RepID=A0A9P7FXG2_9AGAR|nr:hypothetical protein H0H81_009187 [Sphagnurus paluster]
MPLLHRRTFEKSIQENLHHLDPSFGATVLLACAVASRYIENPTVSPGDDAQLSFGWSYFAQLASMYLFGSSIPNACTLLVGLGVRFTQDQGAHRRKPEGVKPTLEDELWKRAFWFLICFDRFSSAFLGRPLSTQDDDFDIDTLIECDDENVECNENGEVVSNQPPSKPSFVQCLKLCEILAFSMRTIYSTNRAKLWSGLVGNEWQSRIVAQVDSALDKWMKWDPHREYPVFCDQSTALYPVYYYVQMQTHRPFMQSDSPMAHSSLATGVNAARSCAHLLDLQFKKRKIALPHVVVESPAATILHRHR